MQLLVIYVAVVKTSSHNSNRPICPLLPPCRPLPLLTASRDCQHSNVYCISQHAIICRTICSEQNKFH